MRPTTRFSAFGALAALAFATSCDSFLDPSPSDVLTPENFYKTSSDAVAATNAVYEWTKWSYWLGFWYISDIATDDIFAGPRFGSDGQRMADGRHVGQRVRDHQPRQHSARSRACHHHGSHAARPAPE